MHRVLGYTGLVGLSRYWRGKCQLIGSKSQDAVSHTTPTTRRRRPWVAAILTLFGVGLGHVYCGRPSRAMVVHATVSVTTGVLHLGV